MAKKAQIATLFENMRERVTKTRNEQDLLANKKARAGAAYAVNITFLLQLASMLIHRRAPLRRSLKHIENSAKFAFYMRRQNLSCKS